MVVSTFEVVRACVKRKNRFGHSVAIAGGFSYRTSWTRIVPSYGLPSFFREQRNGHLRGILLEAPAITKPTVSQFKVI